MKVLILGFNHQSFPLSTNPPLIPNIQHYADLKGSKWGLNFEVVHCPRCNEKHLQDALPKMFASSFGVDGLVPHVAARWINGENRLRKRGNKPYLSDPFSPIV